jgi:hypothetical protein
MAAIFLSYDRDDKNRVARFKQRLEAAGHQVWWDEKMLAGRPQDAEISANIGKADCVIVAWSKNSIQSEWVRAEVNLAKSKTALLPVSLDPQIEIPLPFNLLNTRNLAGWDFESPRPEFDLLLAQIQDLADDANVSTRLPTDNGKIKNGSWPSASRLWFAALIALPTGLGLIGALVAMRWHVPTEIEATLPICSVRMSLQDDGSVPLLETQTLKSITFEHIARAAFAPVEVQPVGASAQQPCWFRSIALGRENVLTSEDLTLVVGQDSGNAPVALQAIALASPSKLVVEKASGCQSRQSSPGQFRIALERGNQVFYVSPVDSLYLDANNARLEGAPGSCASGPVKMLARLADGSPYLEVGGGLKQVAAVLAPLPEGDDIALFGKSGARFSRISVAEQSEANGRPMAALQGEGNVKYPRYEGKQAVRITEDKVINVSDAIGRLRYDKKADRLWLSLSGRVGTFTGTSLAGDTDYRLTLFEKLWYGHLPAALLTIVAWLAAVTVGAVKLYRDVYR